MPRLVSGTGILTVLLTASATAQEPIRVHLLKPSATEFADAASTGVQDAYEDISARLDDKKGLEVVDDAAQADVVLEILARGWMENGVVTTTSNRSWIPGQVTSTSRPDTDPTTVVALRAGSYETIIRVTRPLFWRPQATEVVKRVDRWVKENREQLLARRTND